MENHILGSWTHKYEIPKNSIAETRKNRKYIYFSYHPDHIDPDSFEIFTNKTISIPDHYGDRIYNDLKLKFNCIKLKSNEWFEITKNVRIKSFADWNQDSSLIIETNRKRYFVKP